MEKYTAAMKEAIASAGEAVILHTLEFRHPDFRDDAGQPTAARIVMDTLNLTAPLEEDAPLDAGRKVRFIGVPFRLKPPPEEPSANPEVTIEVDNVSKYLEPYLELGAASDSPIEVTYRPYLSDAVDDGVQMIDPFTLIVSTATSTPTQVTITARMEDLTNKAFLWEMITLDLAPTLAA